MTTAECDLQDFAFMPLDVARLRDSELAANETPEACWAAVLLWAASWHQVPAASIPDDDRWIAKQAGYALRGRIDSAWKRVRDGALRGWVKCSDGRLYHPVVAEKAREAWQAKLKQRWITECGRIKKHNERHDGANVPKPSFEEWVALGCPQGQPLHVPADKPPTPQGSPRETSSNRQGEGQGQGQGELSSAPDGAGGGAAAAKGHARAGRAAKEKTAAEEEKSRIWAGLKVLLVEQEAFKDHKKAGVFLGAQAAKYGADVFLEAGHETVERRPVDAMTYLVGLCETAAGKRQPLGRSAVSDAQRQAANEDTTAEAMRILAAAAGGTPEQEVIDAN